MGLKKVWGLVLMMVCCLCFTACDEGTSAPDVILLGDEQLSVYDKEIPDAFRSGVAEFIFEPDGHIAFIYINHPDVITYKNIKVGDSAKKVKRSFWHEKEQEGMISVNYEGKKEVKSAKGDVQLNYFIEDGTVSRIVIKNNQ